MIYIDCTSTSTICADLNTGIQRVVRQILTQIPPVYRHMTQPVVATTEGYSPVFSPGAALCCHRVCFAPGDILLLLDAGWDLLPYWHCLEAARRSGARLFFVSYDLIPLTHPDVCDPDHVRLFASYIPRAISLADGFIGISRSSRDEISTYVLQTRPERYAQIAFDYFYLGADFHASMVNILKIRKELQQFFTTEEPVYLLVSTIEPRKGHTQLLDVFEKLWQAGIHARLCFIGRIGWCVEEFVTRLHRHPCLGSSLMVWHDLCDEELLYAYRYAKALVFPSVAEGFGLPLIEALHHGLPVIASDIPVHKEIGGPSVRYVSPLDQEGLAAVLLADIKQQKTGASPPLVWQTWAESAVQLLNGIISCLPLAAGQPNTEDSVYI